MCSPTAQKIFIQKIVKKLKTKIIFVNEDLGKSNKIFLTSNLVIFVLVKWFAYKRDYNKKNSRPRIDFEETFETNLNEIINSSQALKDLLAQLIN